VQLQYIAQSSAPVARSLLLIHNLLYFHQPYKAPVIFQYDSYSNQSLFTQYIVYMNYTVLSSLSTRSADSQVSFTKGLDQGKLIILDGNHPAYNVSWHGSRQIWPFLPQPVSRFKGNAVIGDSADFSQFLGALWGQDPPRLTQTHNIANGRNAQLKLITQSHVRTRVICTTTHGHTEPTEESHINDLDHNSCASFHFFRYSSFASFTKFNVNANQAAPTVQRENGWSLRSFDLGDKCILTGDNVPFVDAVVFRVCKVHISCYSTLA